MHRFILLTGLCLFSFFSFAQKTEWYARAGSGLFFFTGETPVKRQGVSLISSSSSMPFAEPHGKLPGFSVTAGTFLQRVTRSHFLFGASLEFQSVCARSKIDQLSTISFSSSSTYAFTSIPVKGWSGLRMNAISLSPFLGVRIGKSKTHIDITGGIDHNFLLNAHQTIEYKGSVSNKVKKDQPTRDGHTDTRLQFQVTLHVQKIHFFAGYATGLSNYYAGYIGGHPEGYSKFIRFGFGYRLK